MAINCESCKFKQLPKCDFPCGNCDDASEWEPENISDKAEDPEDEQHGCEDCAHNGAAESPRCRICTRFAIDGIPPCWESRSDNRVLPEIKDSGKRREFETGAVRDCAEGKGRCDLLPLDVISDYYGITDSIIEEHNFAELAESVLYDLHCFMKSRHVESLYAAMDAFCGTRYIGIEDMLLDYAKHLEEGAKKYAERNWEKGIPTHCYLDSAVRHLLKFMRGDTDEPHDRAFVWNIFGLIWTMKHRPECDDLPKAEGNDPPPKAKIDKIEWLSVENVPPITTKISGDCWASDWVLAEDENGFWHTARYSVDGKAGAKWEGDTGEKLFGVWRWMPLRKAEKEE